MASLNLTNFQDTVRNTEPDNLAQSQAAAILEAIENDLFQGKEDVQPLKWHQLGRIYRLAKAFIQFLIIAWPYIKYIIKLLK